MNLAFMVVFVVLQITITLLIERIIRKRRQRIEKVTTEAIMAERERCAKVAEGEKCTDDTGTDGAMAYNSACDHIAARIRSKA